MNEKLKRGIALALAASMLNISLTLAPAAYAVQPSAPAQTPYYPQTQTTAPAPAGTVNAPAAVQTQPAYSTYSAPAAAPIRTGPTLDQMVVDGLVLRPVMLIATVLGAGLFLVTLPASALGGNVAQAGRKMVVEPAESTFATCLGCLIERNQSKFESWH